MPDAAGFAEAWLFVLVVRSDEVCAEVCCDEPFKVLAGEAFIAQDDLPGSDEVMVLFQKGLGGLAFADISGSPGPR
ncbi:hypothetical protein ASF98_09810 [Arthrobacter sp. Leaf337]|nr:hypothetical protein ASF98_09810 [Arthrobacter sp. Leaf337]